MGTVGWLLLVAVGIALGIGIGRWWPGGTARVKTLEQERDAAREELSNYREEVSAHFAQTAELFDKVTADYRSLYEHLALSARQLGAIRGESVRASLAEPEQRQLAASVPPAEPAGKAGPAIPPAETTAPAEPEATQPEATPKVESIRIADVGPEAEPTADGEPKSPADVGPEPKADVEPEIRPRPHLEPVATMPRPTGSTEPERQLEPDQPPVAGDADADTEELERERNRA